MIQILRSWSALGESARSAAIAVWFILTFVPGELAVLTLKGIELVYRWLIDAPDDPERKE